MIKWLMIPLVVLTLNTEAKELTDQEKQKQQWFHIVTLGDVATTIAGASCVMVKEVNPILNGAQPVGIIGFFVARNIAHEWITKNIISDKWRATWQNTWIGAQSIVVLNNLVLLSQRC